MNPGELFETAIEHWRDAIGKGTALIPAPLNDKLMVLGVLQRVYARAPTCKTIILVNSFSERQDMIEFLTQQENCDENNSEFKQLLDSGNIKIFTYDYITSTGFYFYPFLCIMYRPVSFSQFMVDNVARCKFKLVVLNKLLTDSRHMSNIYKIAPLLPDFKQNEVDLVRTSTPVEECLVPVDIPQDSEAAKLLERYNEYIQTSLSIFESFDVMQQANLGNAQLNISSMQICQRIAQENGWSDSLDMSIPFNLKIDELYNPNSLKERASMTYEIIRNRANLLTDYEGKLEYILNIVRDNPNKKILIINKRADFATIVTDYINNLSEKDVCMNYHDKVDNIPAIDANGNPVFFKSGTRKGERKTIGAKAQKTLATLMFNADKINVLSTNNAPDKDLAIDIDIVIITSPTCEEIQSFMYRLSHVFFRNNKIDLYTIYCRNTLEQTRLDKRTLAANHKLSVKNVYNDEDDCDFVIVD